MLLKTQLKAIPYNTKIIVQWANSSLVYAGHVQEFVGPKLASVYGAKVGIIEPGYNDKDGVYLVITLKSVT